MRIFDLIISTFKSIQILDILDIAFVSFLIYLILKFIRDTRAAQFIKGLLLVLILWQVSQMLSLDASYFILNSILDFGILAMIILFQPELRSILERVGRKGFTRISSFGPTNDRRQRDQKTTELINAVVDATTNLAITKTGALIVIERDTKLGEIVKTGTVVDAAPSASLIMNIFYPKSPLHDVALIIREGRLLSAGCFLPLSNSPMASDLGTRHHAALGVSEISDAVVVVVSEETGIISIALEGKMNRRITPDALTTLLRKYLNNEEVKKGNLFAFWRKKKTNADSEEKEEAHRK